MRAGIAFWQLLRQSPTGPLVALLGLLVLCSLTEGVGILLLVPLLEWLGAGSGPHGWLQRWVGAGLGPPGPAGASVGVLLLVFLLVVSLRSAAQYGRDRVGQRLQCRLVDDLRQRCFAALLAAEWRWLADSRRSDHADLLLADVSRVGQGLHSGLSMLAGLASTGACMVAALLLSPSMALLAMACGAAVFALVAGQRRQALVLGQELTKASRALHGNVQESLAGIKLAKIFGTESRHLAHFVGTAAELRAQQLGFGASNGLSQALFQVAGAGLLAALIYAGLAMWHTPLPVLLTLVLIFSRLIPQLSAVHQQLHLWLHAMPAWQEAQRLLVDCHAHAEPQGDAGEVLPETAAIQRAIQLRDVRIAYPGRDAPALDVQQLNLPARTTTAIVGASGAGKSTLADVLAGLLVPGEGEMIVDGVVIGGAARRTWRSRVAYVPQEVFLFHATIRENLRWAVPGATELDMLQALHQAAADFVLAWPEGMETVVGDGGTRLSGGERQRIALARALLRRPSLLILDEATSALDVDNEARIRKAIEQLHGDLTVVIIGHRLATLEHADQVIVLADGRIIAQGDWLEVRPFMEISAT